MSLKRARVDPGIFLRPLPNRFKGHALCKQQRLQGKGKPHSLHDRPETTPEHCDFLGPFTQQSAAQHFVRQAR